MPVALAKITPGLFPDLYQEMLRDWNPAIGEASWRRAFINPATSGDDGGYVLTDGGRIVGMLGTIFSQRQINGHERTFCNLHSWRVKPEYRGKGLLLLRPIQALSDVTCTDLTPSDEIIPIMTRLGFSRLDRSATVLPPSPWRSKSAAVAIEDLTEPAERYQGELSPADLRIYEDHRSLDCRHLLVRAAGQSCYLVASCIAQGWLSHWYVHYISDVPRFAAHHLAIRAHLTRGCTQSFVVVDSRLLGETRVPFACRIRSTEKLYRSRDVAPRDIDGLYSEQVILKHSSLLSWRMQFHARIGRHTPHVVRRFLRSTQ